MDISGKNISSKIKLAPLCLYSYINYDLVGGAKTLIGFFPLSLMQVNGMSKDEMSLLTKWIVKNAFVSKLQPKVQFC
jgi:hypothetical protein